VVFAGSLDNDEEIVRALGPDSSSTRIPRFTSSRAASQGDEDDVEEDEEEGV
jgi:hypothetical protein